MASPSRWLKLHRKKNCTYCIICWVSQEKASNRTVTTLFIFLCEYFILVALLSNWNLNDSSVTSRRIFDPVLAMRQWPCGCVAIVALTHLRKRCFDGKYLSLRKGKIPEADEKSCRDRVHLTNGSFNVDKLVELRGNKLWSSRCCYIPGAFFLDMAGEPAGERVWQGGTLYFLHCAVYINEICRIIYMYVRNLEIAVEKLWRKQYFSKRFICYHISKIKFHRFTINSSSHNNKIAISFVWE